MSRKPRIFPTTVFIACEGSNTEPNYFERLKEELEDDGYFQITIYPDTDDTDPKTHAIGLIKECQSRIDEFDEVWAVYDKDGYTKHKEAIDLANTSVNGKTVNVAFSSISFEHWVLLHFERNSKGFTKSECKYESGKTILCGSNTSPDDCEGNRCVVSILRSKGYFPNYSKKANQDIYPHLKNRTLDAIKNSVWLRDFLNRENPDRLIFERNPYTNVDVLMKKLLRINEEFQWGIVGVDFDILEIRFRVLLGQNGSQLNFQIQNRRIINFTLNEIQICFVDDHGAETAIQLGNTILEPQQTENFDYPRAEGQKLFLIKIGSNRIYFELN